MDLKRKSTVAHTPADESNLNKLRVPEFGVRQLTLVAGAKKSLFHLPKGGAERFESNDGSDDFHFAPEYETVELVYDIDDPLGATSGARLELYTRFEKKPQWSLDLAKLGSDWLAHGEHKVKWDGRIIEQPAAEQKGTATQSGYEHDLTAFDPTDKLAPFPDGYVTLEHTPYKLKLVLESSEPKQLHADPGTGWTFFHILLKKIELELAPKECVPAAAVGDEEHERNKVVWQKISDDGGVPGKDDADPREVILLSNLYKTDLVQMENDTFFTKYQNLWKEGPKIPIVAKIRLADSADNEVKIDETDKGAVALGGAKFLWDWEDPDEDVSSGDAKRTSFVGKAIDFYKDGTDARSAAKDHTYPKGDNCHKDRGGKRGPDADPVFPEQAGYDPKDALDDGKFPFPVKPIPEKGQRRWASLSRGWTKGKLKGKTGAVFQPSRIAGDDYQLTVYLAFDKELDKDKKVKLCLDSKDEPLKAPEAIQAKTGKFQTWRRIDLSRYVAKDASLTYLPGAVPGIQPYFEQCYVKVENTMGGGNAYNLANHRVGGTAPDYNKAWEDTFKASGGWFWNSWCSVKQGDDHMSVASMVKTRTYAEFVHRVHAHLNGVSDAQAGTDMAYGAGFYAGWGANDFAEGLGGVAAWPATNVQDNRLLATKASLGANNVATKAAWSSSVDDTLFSWSDAVIDKLKIVSGSPAGGDAAKDGMITIHFDHTHSQHEHLVSGSGGYWYGKVLDPSDADDKHGVVCFWVAGDDMFAHEMGHNVFLPHAKYPTANAPGGFREALHDDDDTGCLMSYSSARHGFCGLCELRLRGWKGSALDKDDAKNKKP